MAERVEAEASIQDLTIAIIGGTGDQGRGLATRWTAAGLNVIIGSRDADRAHDVAETLGAGVVGMTNVDAANAGDLIVVAVPWSAHEETVAQLVDAASGKTVIDCVNPLGFDSSGPFALDVPEGSAAQQAARLLPDSHVVAAIHHVSSVVLLDPTIDRIEADVLVLGDHRPATDQVQALAAAIPGTRGVYAGRLRNAGQVEALTANLIAINRRYRSHAGVRITDV